MYDFVAQVKVFYYDSKIWTDFAEKSPIHSEQWFGKVAGAMDINTMLKQVAEVPHINITYSEAIRMEREEKERFNRGNSNGKKMGSHGNGNGHGHGYHSASSSRSRTS